ncbi:MAG: hypothetical protein JXN64_00375 [Spirochaetes bacterium]|nr:hypothetical protein [Spirochaetota bacterium]
MKKTSTFYICVLLFLMVAVISSGTISTIIRNANAETASEYWDRDFQKANISIKSTKGKLYAYIVLLFNENPHFVNLIQEGSISPEMLQKEGFHVKEYKNYLETTKNAELRKLTELVFNLYQNPGKFNDKALEAIQEDLSKQNVILRFSKIKNHGSEKIYLDYCIFGRKEPINISHPLFEIQEKLSNIQPYIYYDEFSTSNSTFYFDMIYINPDEVNNDYLIAQNLINGKNIDSMFFVGAKVNDNIKYCILHAFSKSLNIKNEILQMFIIHEITHKILNNQYKYFDQVTGEEMALLSTIYHNPYLGLAVLYSYLDYSRINPHWIAAMNIVRFIANKTGRQGLVDDLSDLKYLPINEIKRLIKEDFNMILKNIKNH